MKKKTILGLFLLLGIGMSITSCEDMLTPDINRSAENFNGKDTVSFYLGIIRNVQDMIEQNVLLGEIRSDIADTTMYTSDSIADIANFKRIPDGENELLNRAAYYKVINQCNFYLDKVDSLASKNNIFYMRKETAQVLLIRAWTYMQLVQAYGRVPFITQPVANANTGLETNPEDWATADNLVDLLSDDLAQALTYEKAYGYPTYGTFETGQNSIPYGYMCFYTNLVAGDLYLLRGRDQADYVAAAKHYYDFLNELTNAPSDANVYKYITDGWRAQYTQRFTMRGGNRTESFEPSVNSWCMLYYYSTPQNMYNEIYTMIPSASNTAFGKVMTRVPQIYGFDPHSTTQTTTSEDHDDSGSATTVITSSGQVSVVANHKNRQLAPSARFEAISKYQPYFWSEDRDNDGVLDEYDYVYDRDARYYGACPEVNTTDGRFRFIQKFCGSYTSNGTASVNSFNFRYIIGIYRLRQIQLRFAEALNRAGYPRYAYAVLRGGLHYQRLPQVKESWEYNDVEKTRKRVWVIDTIIDTQYHLNFIGADEVRRAEADPNFTTMLDFSDERWQNTCGIHELGGGLANVLDTLNEYGVVVAQRIADEELRTKGAVSEEVRQLTRKLRAGVRGITVKDDEEGEEEETEEERLQRERQSYTIIEADEPQEADPREIDAVESLIADECALEIGFEGFRFYDLVRFARHKNNDTTGLYPSDYGTRWLAWQVARRSVKLALYEEPNTYDHALYNLLLNDENWYLVNPEY